MRLREPSDSNWRIVVLVAVMITLAGCKRQLPGGPNGENEPAPSATVDPTSEPSVNAANLVPITDVDAAEFLKLDRPWKGDLSQIGERRFIRALVAYNQTNYFLDGPTQHGTAYYSLGALEQEIRARLGRGHLAPKILIIPTSRDRMLPALAAGYGDIAIGGLAITPQRQRIVDFSDPVLENSRALVVTGPSAPPIATLDDLSGKEVHVRPSSSYHEGLVALNHHFRYKGKKPVVIIPADELLEDEDLIQLVDAGAIGITVVHEHTAKFWSQLYDHAQTRDDLVVRDGDRIAWALRKHTPELKSLINDFVRTRRVGTMFGDTLLKRYYGSVERLKNPRSSEDLQKYQQLADIFRKYADQYNLPWLLLVAQGYQESRLDQTARSPVGATGVMQLMPETATDIGLPDVSTAEKNIHAGAKYLRMMLDLYFKHAPMDRLDKGLFALASYNAGAGRVAGLRRKAWRMGFDPNKWFNNVEIIAAREIGRETVDYVSNIYKYYTVYKSVADIRGRKLDAGAQ